MAQITKLNVPDVGECAIHFSIKDGTFEVRLPNEVSYKISGVLKVPTLRTWKEVQFFLEEIRKVYVHEVRLKRKVIIIQMQTSVSNWQLLKPKWTIGSYKSSPEMEMQQTADKLSSGEGFVIKWFIAEEYEYDRGVVKYMLTETHSNCRDYIKEKINKSIEILHQLLSNSDGEFRVLTYREDMHEWLKGLDKSIASMLEKMISYFDYDNDKFIANFENSTLLLNPFDNTKQ